MKMARRGGALPSPLIQTRRAFEERPSFDELWSHLPPRGGKGRRHTAITTSTRLTSPPLFPIRRTRSQRGFRPRFVLPPPAARRSENQQVLQLQKSRPRGQPA